MALYGGQSQRGVLHGEDDSRLRPYNQGITPHEGSVATILLYTNSTKSNDESDGVVNDYLSEFEQTILTLESEAIGSTDAAPPEMPGGKIATFSLDNREDNNYYGVFNNFSLLAVSEKHEEIIKLHQNFSDGWNAFFFGEKPVVYNFSGLFIDSMDYPYYQEFMIAYAKFLSGRKVIDNDMRMKIMYDGKIISGYMLNLSSETNAAIGALKSFRFTILVQDIQWVRLNYIQEVGEITGRLTTTEAWNSMDNKLRIPHTLNEPLTNDGSGSTAKTRI